MFIVALKFILLFSAVSSFQMPDYTFAVGIFYRRNYSFQCAGGIVSPNAVLTSCSCIGMFDKRKDNFYDFIPLDVNKFFIATIMSDNKTYEIQKQLVHGHCKPSKYDEDLYVYDLGAWKIKGTFDKSVPMMEVQNSRSISLQELSESNPMCQILVNENPIVWSLRSYRLDISDPVNCGKRHCYFSSDKTKVVCTDLLAQDVKEGTICSTFDYNATRKLDSSRGSPVICEGSVWGIVSSNRKTSVLWSRIDWENNMDFLYMVNETIKTMSLSSSHCSDLILVLIFSIGFVMFM
ncbi:uncharacterized protein LOC112126212 [Cimex lectularius]|uniref:Peptidase S1 domain-containing protein n=1 Tax=Cimex lectularius TaxID=79782 RepID=A0A8I6SEJ2_CIMLE|nr:uncharacterized protein LOC112126212 [Cimex lectularius]